MNLPEIVWDICEVCEPCQARLVCRTRAIVKIDPDQPPYIEHSRCSGCAVCIKACPCSAIRIPGVKLKPPR